jgi:Gpi18-like mannosyltransferase
MATPRSALATDNPPRALPTAPLPTVAARAVPARLWQGLALILLAALLMRLVLLPNPGAIGDNLFFQQWGDSAAAEGLGGIYNRDDRLHLTYPPTYIYFLALDGVIHRALAEAAGRPWPPADLDPAFYMVQKLNPIAADLLVVALLALATWRRLGVGGALAGAAAYGLNPALAYVSGYWGQADGVVLAILVSAFLAIAARRPVLSGALLGLAFATKPQAMLFVLMLGVFLLAQDPTDLTAQEGQTWQERLKPSLAWLGKAVGAGVVTLLVLLLPFLLGGSGLNVLNPYTHAVGYVPFVDQQAFNIWWLVYGPESSWMLDTTPVLLILTARQVGLLLLLATMVSVVLLYRRALRPTLGTGGGTARSYATALALLATALAFFLLPTQMHERYVLYSLPPLLLAILWAPRRARWWWGVYAGLSGLVLLNLYFAAALIPLDPAVLPLFADIGRGVAVALLAIGGWCGWLLFQAGRAVPASPAPGTATFRQCNGFYPQSPVARHTPHRTARHPLGCGAQRTDTPPASRAGYRLRMIPY